MKGRPAPVDIELARKGLGAAAAEIASRRYQMIVLDEINVAIDFKLIRVDEVVSLLKSKPSELDIILTGRYASPEIVDLADMVSEINEIKHHYSAGIKERAGIEF